MLKLIDEVAISGSSSTAHHGNALGKERKGQLLVEVKHAFFLQLLHDFLSFACHVAHRKGGVDVVHNP